MKLVILHFMKNVLAHAGGQGRRVVSAFIAPAFVQNDSDGVRRQWRRVADQRMDAFLSETDDQGRMVSYGRVATVAVVGNEDGAHHVSAELYQALNDVGFSLAPNAVAYWVGEAMGSVDFRDLKETPAKVENAVEMLSRNAVHLARLLKSDAYPGE